MAPAMAFTGAPALVGVPKLALPLRTTSQPTSACSSPRPALAGAAPAGSSPWIRAAGATAALTLTRRLAKSAAPTTIEPPVESKKAKPHEPLGYFEPADQVGALEPLGYWDPAGFSVKDDQEGFRKLRTAEVKHGRVAMMAAVGAVAQHFVKFPGFEGMPSGLAAVITPPGSYGVILLLVAAGGFELGLWTENPDKAPGDFGDPLGVGMFDNEMRNRELNNGRFAMFAAIGIIAAELLTGKDAIQQLPF